MKVLIKNGLVIDPINSIKEKRDVVFSEMNLVLSSMDIGLIDEKLKGNEDHNADQDSDDGYALDLEFTPCEAYALPGNN